MLSTVFLNVKKMNVLGIETSCDDTGIAIYNLREGLIGQALHTQAHMHQRYGGVVPELASRDHMQHILPLTQAVLAQANLPLKALSAVAYTGGPGLSGALLTGGTFAEALAFALKIPAVAVHHLEGHLLSPFLSKTPPEFPFIALLASGGHTQLIAAHELGRYEILGESLDDAAGEAFDKSAKLLGLGYPGGPEIAALASRGCATRFRLPRPMLHTKDLNFSFSGLKTAVSTLVKAGLSDETARADLAAGVQAAIVEVLVGKSMRALELHPRCATFVVAGGVSANSALREGLFRRMEGKAVSLHFPELSLCTDNGAMIALAGALRFRAGALHQIERRLNGEPDVDFLNHRSGPVVKPRWPLDELAREVPF